MLKLPLKVLIALVLAILVLAFPHALPMLAPFLDPVNGVGGVGFTKELPTGTVDSPFGNAIVVWDEYGIPHVYAESPETAAYALGWVQASQRLFQMDLYRRVALGNLSSLVGWAGVENDVLVNKLGMAVAVEEAWERIASDPGLLGLKSVLEAFSRGVNDYMKWAVDSGNLPIEYRVLGNKPYPWRPQDSVALAKLLTLMLAWDRDDLVLAKLVNRHGTQIIGWLDIVERKRNVAHASCDQATAFGKSLSTLMQESSKVASATRYPDPSGALMEADGLALGGGFSNNWVVSASLGPEGKPLVANDPHLTLQAPPIWFVVHVEAPGWNVAGVTIPGSPLVIIGRNPHVAWGFTNVGSDFTDFYYYKWVDNDTYVYKDTVLKVEEEKLVLSVWNPLKRSYETHETLIRRTIHGPLLEGPEGEPYAVAFTGSLPSLDVAFIWGLNQARTVEDALEAQKRYFIAPVQNLVVADDRGFIAYSPNGGYPKRTNVPMVDIGGRMIPNTGFLPYNGSHGEGEWMGLMDFDELPVLVAGPVDPVPYIATANSKPWDGECVRLLGWSYHDRFRTERIYQLLEEYSADGLVGVEDSQAIQQDLVDNGVRVVAEIILDLLGERGDVDTNALEALRNFVTNPLMEPGSREANLAMAAAMVFHSRVWETIYGERENRYFFKVEMLEELYSAYKRGEEWTAQLLGGNSLEQMAMDALEEAMGMSESATSAYSVIAPDFRYYNIKNPVLPLHYERLPAKGGPFTVRVAPPAIIDPVEGAPVEVGPSVNLVSPLATTELFISLPGGQSSNPLSTHYQDLYLEYWYEGRYLRLELGQDLRDRDLPQLVFVAEGGE